jgi:conjugative transfer pilus assembly protein TraH
MSIRKKIIISVALLSYVIVANAGLGADMGSLFLSNTSAPSKLTTSDRTGVFGGSFAARAPIKNVNLIAFDPPRWSSGCGSVDLHMGSFSFVSSQQLIATFRAVASNAAGLAFKAAIDLVSPSLGKLISEFQTLLQTMNNLGKNSCALAQTIVNAADKVIGNAVDGSGSISATAKGAFSDVNSGIDSITSGIASANNGLKSFLGTTGKTDPNQGNSIIKALVASGATNILGVIGIGNADGSSDEASNPNSINNKIVVGFLGYHIKGIACVGSSQDGSSKPNNDPSSIGQIQCIGPHTLVLKDLVDGGGTGSYNPKSPLHLYTCLNPDGDMTSPDPQICTQMQMIDWNYQGVRAWINTSLFGSADDTTVMSGSILDMMNSGTSTQFTSAQKQFVAGPGAGMIGLLRKTSDINARNQIARTLRTPVENCVVSALGHAIYKAGVGTTYNNSFDLGPDAKKQLEILKSDSDKADHLCQADTEFLKIMNMLNAQTSLNNSSKK